MMRFAGCLFSIISYMDTQEKKTEGEKQTTKQPKERKKKDKPPHFCEIKYYLNYTEEERDKIFTVRFD